VDAYNKNGTFGRNNSELQKTEAEVCTVPEMSLQGVLRMRLPPKHHILDQSLQQPDSSFTGCYFLYFMPSEVGRRRLGFDTTI
jgi:hypothetical protein